MSPESVFKLAEPAGNITPFAVEVHKIKGGIHVQAHGDLDLTTIRVLEGQLHASMEQIESAGQNEQLILDIRDLEFIDSAGLALLIKISKQLAAKNQILKVIMGKGNQPERILKIGRFDKILELTYTLSE